VLLLDEMLRAVEQAQACGGTRWRIGAAKFVKPVRPGETLTLEHETPAEWVDPLPYRERRTSGGARGARARDRPAEPHDAQAAPSPPARGRGGAQWAERTRARQRDPPEDNDLPVTAARGPVARGLLHLIAAYFFAFAPARAAARARVLHRALGREPSATDRYRQVYAFASTILDRLYLMHERYDLFAISIEGEELDARHGRARQRGVSARRAPGSFEIMSAVGRRRPGLRVAMAMYERNASRGRRIFPSRQRVSAPEIIALGQLEAMLRIRDCLDEGKFVGMLADRTSRMPRRRS